jgi:hypothetical protein
LTRKYQRYILQSDARELISGFFYFHGRQMEAVNVGRMDVADNDIIVGAHGLRFIPG